MMQTPDYYHTYEIHEVAAEHNMRVNQDRAEAIAEMLNANEIKYGAPYCPCLNNHTKDTICPCKYMREMQACRCGLYLRKDGE